MRGVIYQIFSKHSDKVYIGSTNDLYKRFNVHKSMFNKYINGDNKKYCSSYKIMKYDDVEISPLKIIDYEEKKQLRQEEYNYIMLNIENCVNKNIPGRDRKQYYHDNKEKFKQYYQENKEHIKDYQNKNKEYIKQYQKAYRENHKDYFKEYSKNYNLKKKKEQQDKNEENEEYNINIKILM